MIGKSLSRNELKQFTGGHHGQAHCWPGEPIVYDAFRCQACTSSCLYEFGGPGAGCPPGGNCVLVECASMEPCCWNYEGYGQRAVCDWEV